MKSRCATAIAGFAGVKGRGMMRGLDVGAGEVAAQIVKACLARGLVIETSGAHDEIVKVLSPLTIEDDELRAGPDRAQGRGRPCSVQPGAGLGGLTRR